MGNGNAARRICYRKVNLARHAVD